MIIICSYRKAIWGPFGNVALPSPSCGDKNVRRCRDVIENVLRISYFHIFVYFGLNTSFSEKQLFCQIVIIIITPSSNTTRLFNSIRKLPLSDWFFEHLLLLPSGAVKFWHSRWWLWRFGNFFCFTEKMYWGQNTQKYEISMTSERRPHGEGRATLPKGPFVLFCYCRLLSCLGGKCKAIHNSFRDTLYHTVEEDDLVTSSDVNHFPQQPAY